MRALVTGGAGFLGSHVAAALVAGGHEVVVLDDLSGGFADQVPDGARFVQGSVTDVELVEKLCREHRFDVIYHLAAYAAEGLSHYIRRFNYTNNVVGSVNLINAAVNYGVRVFVFTSSIAVYGAQPTPMREDQAPRPEDPYGIAKYAVELDLEAARRVFGLQYVVFRPHNVYGEHQNLGDPYRNVIGIFMRQLLEGEPLTVFGDGEQRRAFTYVGDVAPVIARAPEVSEAYGQVINIGADQPYTVNALARAVMDAMGIEGRVEHLPPRPEVRDAWADHSLARRLFGETARTSLEEGLRRMASWAKRVGVRRSRPFTGIELPAHLPAPWRCQR